MANDSQNRNQQSGSGSDQGTAQKQGEQGHKKQQGQQPPKKDVQSNQQNQGTEKSGTR
ncbi:MAG: hypothetical protein WA399_02920 [Acidobacteriaceae bacterium]